MAIATIYTFIIALFGSWLALACYVFAPEVFQQVDVSDMLSAMVIGSVAIGGSGSVIG